MALKGIKVVEFAGLAPAPFCGMVLADFGASVIRIDKKDPGPDLDCLGHGKKSVCLDLKSPESTRIIKKLIKSSDVSIDPFRAGVMENLNLGPEVLMNENPRLIYARLSGYGQSGPYSKRAGHDINYLAISGLLSLFGRKGEKPMFPVNLAADFGGGGLMCALGIILALFEREKSGFGQIVDANMVQGVSYLGSFLYRSQNIPLIWGNERGENMLDSGAPFYDTYRTKDNKYVAVGAIEPQFYSELLRGLELTEAEAPQFEFEHNRKLFEAKFSQKTRDEWTKIFETLDACVAPVLELGEAANDPHNKSGNTFTENGGVQVPTPAPRLSRTPPESTGVLERPAIGQHTVEILSELGYTSSEIATLKEKNLLYCGDSSKL